MIMHPIQHPQSDCYLTECSSGCCVQHLLVSCSLLCCNRVGRSTGGRRGSLGCSCAVLRGSDLRVAPAIHTEHTQALCGRTHIEVPAAAGAGARLFSSPWSQLHAASWLVYI
jgi:hypothetical protein